MSKNLKQCTVVLTRACNLRCEFCYVKSAGYSETDFIEYKDLKSIVDFCTDSEVKFMFFTGGEPLTYPYLKEILNYIKEKQHPMVVAIATNGILLQKKGFCEDLIHHGVEYIDISMKGYDSKAWMEITGFDGLEIQYKAIQNLASLPIEFTCSMVITHQNVQYFLKSVYSAKRNGAKQFSFTFVIDNNNEIEKDYVYLQKNNPINLIDAFISQVDQLNSITEEWWIEYSFPMCMYTEKQLDILLGRLASPCQIHMKNAVTFNTKMELLPCDMYIKNKLGKLGRDFSSYEELIKLNENENYNDIMEDIRKLPADDCKLCKYLKHCYGGCPILWKNYSYATLMDFKRNN